MTRVASGPNRRATCSMAHTAVPPEPPTSSPSSRASRRAVRNESPSETITYSSSRSRVEGGRPEVLADPFDEVGVDVVGLREDRPLRIGADDQQVGLALPQEPRRPRDRPAGADGEDDRVDLAAGLLPELRPGRLVVRLRIRLVRVLIGLERARDLLGQPVGDRVVRLRRLRRHRGRADDHLGAVPAQERALLLGDLVGHDEDAAVALDRGGDRQADARVPARWLDDRAPGPELPLPLGRLDHADPDAVLHAPAGIHVLELGEERRADVRADPLQAHERRPAHQVEHRRVVARHGGSLSPWRRFGHVGIRGRRRRGGRTRPRSCTRRPRARRRASRPPSAAPSLGSGAGGRRAPWP